jgi:hypothetical protein
MTDEKTVTLNMKTEVVAALLAQVGTPCIKEML